jgi:uncharacterized protein
MIYIMFRPSDDTCLYSFYVPSNLFAAVSLRQLAEMGAEILKNAGFAAECRALAGELEEALAKNGRIKTRDGEIWAFAVDGYGNQFFMDDANIPGLPSLPYLGCYAANGVIYQRTRTRVLSDDNPYCFKGSAASGIGGPHEGLT